MLKIEKLLTHVLFVLIFLIPATGISSQSKTPANSKQYATCEAEIYRGKVVDLQLLEQLAQKQIENSGVESGKGSLAPLFLQNALPEGARFLEKPLRDAGNFQFYKDIGSSYIAIKIPVAFKGKTYYVNVGLNPKALAQNALSNRKKSIVTKDARAVGLFIHGGGTKRSSWINGANSASYFAQNEIDIISIDFFAHGENFPESYFSDPQDYVDFILSFMEKFLTDTGVPVFGMGHSMGAQVWDIISTHATPEKLQKDYPKLAKLLKGFLIWSPPPGAESFQSSIDRENDEIRTDEAEITDAKLLLNDNINLQSQEVLAQLQMLHIWIDQLIEDSKKHLPLFWIMGGGDTSCFKVNYRNLFEKFMQARHNVSPENFIVVDQAVNYKKEVCVPDHIIPNFYSMYRLDPKIKEKFRVFSTPIVYLESLRFVEHVILGNMDFDPYYYPKTDEEEEAHRKEHVKKISSKYDNDAESLSNVFALYAQNPVFRSFLKKFHFNLKRSLDKSRISRLDEFIKLVRAFTKYLSTKQSDKSSEPVSSLSINFSELNVYLKDPNREFNSVQELFDFLSKVLSGEAHDELNLALIASDFNGMQINFTEISKAFQNGDAKVLAIVGKTTNLLRQHLESDFGKLLSNNVEAQELLNKKVELEKHYTQLLNYRADSRLISLQQLKSQLTQINKLFSVIDTKVLLKNGHSLMSAKDAIGLLSTDTFSQEFFAKVLFKTTQFEELNKKLAELLEKQARNDEASKRRKSNGSSSTTYENSEQELSDALRKTLYHLDNAQLKAEIDDIKAQLFVVEESFKELFWVIKDYYLNIVKQNYEALAFDSQLGVRMRDFFSDLDKQLSEVFGNERNPADRVSKDKFKLNVKNIKTLSSFVRNFAAIQTRLSVFYNHAFPEGVPFVNHTTPLLEEAINRKEDAELLVYKTLQDFLAMKDQVLKEFNEGKQGDVKSPVYPKEYYELITLFDEAQQKYKDAKAYLAEVTFSEALSGNLGSYPKYLAHDRDYLIKEIEKLDGYKSFVPEKQKLSWSETTFSNMSLAEIEYWLQVLNIEINKTESTLFKMMPVQLFTREENNKESLWDTMDLGEYPGIEFLNNLFRNWNAIYRVNAAQGVDNSY